MGALTDIYHWHRECELSESEVGIRVLQQIESRNMVLKSLRIPRNDESHEVDHPNEHDKHDFV